MKFLVSLFALIALLQVVNSAHAFFGYHPITGRYDYPYGPYGYPNTQYVQDVAVQTVADADVVRTTPPVSYPVTSRPMPQYRMQPAPEGTVSPTARYYNQQ